MDFTSDSGGLPYTRQQMMLITELADLEGMTEQEACEKYNVDYNTEAERAIIEYWT
ncbi:hypothetical protein Barb6XT_03204 [Bacteroidales bacterium Barb6XT]|nr:hypothetical protein Barb6XT_03204 [Bacteroidales bacterium Barb6XT]